MSTVLRRWKTETTKKKIVAEEIWYNSHRSRCKSSWNVFGQQHEKLEWRLMAIVNKIEKDILTPVVAMTTSDITQIYYPCRCNGNLLHLHVLANYLSKHNFMENAVHKASRRIARKKRNQTSQFELSGKFWKNVELQNQNEKINKCYRFFNVSDIADCPRSLSTPWAALEIVNIWGDQVKTPVVLMTKVEKDP